MKKSLTLLLVLFSTTLISFTSYKLGIKKTQSTQLAKNSTPFSDEENSLNQENDINDFDCPYVFQVEQYNKKVFSPSKAVMVWDEPELVEDAQSIKLNKPFNQKKFENGLYKIGGVKSWESRSFNVDDDSEDELIISANVAMNHTLHIAMIVKNEQIIFEKEGANIWITEVFGGAGFILEETIDWNSGERKKTGYAYKDGGFIPVWNQKGCEVIIE